MLLALALIITGGLVWASWPVARPTRTAAVKVGAAPPSWAPFVPLMRVMWRDPTTRARGAVALDARYADAGTELASAIDLLDRAQRYDEDAIAEIMTVRGAAEAGNLAQQRYLTLLRYANEARKTQAAVAAPLPAVAQDPYHRLA